MFREGGSVRALVGVGSAVMVLMGAMDKVRSRMASSAGVTVSELRILFLIAESGRVRPTSLAVSTDLSMGAVTAISDRLVDRDLVCRVANPHDRRSLFLELTPDGTTLMDGLYETLRAHIERAEDALNPSQRVVLERQLLGIASELVYDLDEVGEAPSGLAEHDGSDSRHR